jgi:hypothetical protein
MKLIMERWRRSSWSVQKWCTRKAVASVKAARSSPARSGQIPSATSSPAPTMYGPASRPAYLGTSDPANVAVYHWYGFEVTDPAL